MAKKPCGAIIEAFGEVKKAAEENKKARDAQERSDATQAIEQKRIEPVTAQKADNIYSGNEEYTKETKTKRVNFLLYPSVYETAKKQAKKHRQSLNDYVNTVLAIDK